MKSEIELEYERTMFYVWIIVKFHLFVIQKLQTNDYN